MTAQIRVGAVSYLNARPLSYRLTEHSPNVQLIVDLPSRLAERLEARELDVALIPSVEYYRGRAAGSQYEIVPGFAIAARGPVRSVKLFSRVPFGQIQRLALDAGSRTSQALAQVWLAERHQAQPERVELLPMGVPLEESTADAVLLIGDRAMGVSGEGFHAVIDLAEAWNTWTGLPFVFAVWVARAGAELGDLPEALARSRSEGLAHAAEIAAESGPRLGLEILTCFEYLTRALSYDLGEPELAGLRLFARKAAALGLAPEGVDLVFHRGRDLAARR
ncbi:MAG TPA: menaquinone biosynthesis protein [Isosphaeraceae bacterium]|nr:menaquinone biosynthesis protein [Isosphaeraceae bacterium]